MAKKKDILLEHEYDGIQELDNELPGWWLGLFYITIAISVVYLFYYHTGIGPLQAEEYQMAIDPEYKSERQILGSGLFYHSPFYASEADITPRQRALLALQAGPDGIFAQHLREYLSEYDKDEGTGFLDKFEAHIGSKASPDNLIMEAMLRADESKRAKLKQAFPDLWAVATSGGGALPAADFASATTADVSAAEPIAALTAAGDLNSGSDIFKKNCVSCHLADGGGAIGPNLTDDYWIHGAGINNLVKIINSGVPSKGMITWRGVLKEKEILQVASYILTLHGTEPANPKSPQGEKVEYPLN